MTTAQKTNNTRSLAAVKRFNTIANKLFCVLYCDEANAEQRAAAYKRLQSIINSVDNQIKKIDESDAVTRELVVRIASSIDTRYSQIPARLIASFATTTDATTTDATTTDATTTDATTTDATTSDAATTTDATTSDAATTTDATPITVRMSVFEDFSQIPGNAVILAKKLKSRNEYLAIYPARNSKLLTSIKLLLSFAVAESQEVKKHNDNFTVLSKDEIKQIYHTYDGDAIKIDRSIRGRLKAILPYCTKITRTNSRGEISQTFDYGEKLSKSSLNISPKDNILSLKGSIMRAAIHKKALGFLSKCDINKRIIKRVNELICEDNK